MRSSRLRKRTIRQSRRLCSLASANDAVWHGATVRFGPAVLDGLVRRCHTVALRRESMSPSAEDTGMVGRIVVFL